MPPNPPPATPDASPLLSAKQAGWTLTDAKDFARGKRYGTAVTSSGRLTLVPAVRSVYQPKSLIPWKTAAFGDTVYLAGWGSNRVLALREHGDCRVISPTNHNDVQGAKAVTALAVRQDGALLLATWPDRRVLLLRADGTVVETWILPCAVTWDLAVTTAGACFAAGDSGTVFELGEHGQVTVACSTPDLHVYALAPDNDGGLLLATAPRGKIYRLSADGHFSAVYDAGGTAMTSVTSLAVDAAGNIYAGLSPSCSVLRIAKDGSAQTIMSGVGKDNKHVFALKIVGDDLYAATGLAGGIYRISSPAGIAPDVTAIYAREDQRGDDGDELHTGPESLAVTSLAVTAGGALLRPAPSRRNCCAAPRAPRRFS